MSDHDQLRQLGPRYARAADSRDLDGLAALFHPDAVIDGTRGRLGMSAWLEAMAAPAAFPTSMHMMGDPLIAMEPGGDAARLDTYAVVYQLGDAAINQKDMTLGMRYQDRVVRSGEDWLIVERVARTVWVR